MTNTERRLAIYSIVRKCMVQMIGEEKTAMSLSPAKRLIMESLEAFLEEELTPKPTGAQIALTSMLEQDFRRADVAAKRKAGRK